jgi:glutamyl-tRNA synthetase
LHVGHARTFLLAWWHARSRGGRVLLRLEDLDRARVRAGMAEECLRDLEWLGIDWDGPVKQQSADTAPFAAAVQRLFTAGRAYACACSRSAIEAASSAPQAGSEERRYPGTCRTRGLAWSAGDAGLGLRLAVPPGEVTLEDGVRGAFRVDVQREVGDFLLARRDGAFAYQLAVVVDDAADGVSEVLRGDDLLASAARQWHLQRALGLPHPRWFHVPLVVGDDGARLAKRRDDLALSALRARGVDARALVAWVAQSAGLEAREPASARELVAAFDLARLSPAPVRFGARELAGLVDARPPAPRPGAP